MFLTVTLSHYDLHQCWLCGWRGIFVGDACTYLFLHWHQNYFCVDICNSWKWSSKSGIFTTTVIQRYSSKSTMMPVSSNEASDLLCAVWSVLSCCRWYHYIPWLRTHPSIIWWIEKLWSYFKAVLKAFYYTHNSRNKITISQINFRSALIYLLYYLPVFCCHSQLNASDSAQTWETMRGQRKTTHQTYINAISDSKPQRNTMLSNRGIPGTSYDYIIFR